MEEYFVLQRARAETEEERRLIEAIKRNFGSYGRFCEWKREWDRVRTNVLDLIPEGTSIVLVKGE